MNTPNAQPAKKPANGWRKTASASRPVTSSRRPDADELKTWLAQSGKPLKSFFNTSGLKYKALGLKDKLPRLGEDEQIALLASDGMLVKRPLVVGKDFVLAGFREKEWQEKLI